MATQQPSGNGPPNDGAPHPADAESSALQRYAPPSVSASKTNETGAIMLAARARAEIEAGMIVALQNPRDVDRFREIMLKTCDRPIFADQAMYEKPTGKDRNGRPTFATGLSIRYAEEAARNFKNLDISTTVIAEDDEARTIEAKGVDLETNVWYRAQAKFAKYVERRNPRQGEEVVGSRTNSTGQTVYKVRASDDQIFMEHQRHAAKATREVTLKLIPSWVKEECEERIGRTLDQVGGDPEKFREALVVQFEKKGVSLSAMEHYLGLSLASADLSQLRLLKRIYNAIHQGETTWAEIAGAKEAEAAGDGQSAATKAGTDGLRESLAGKAKAAPAAETPAKAAPKGAAPAAEATPVATSHKKGVACTDCGSAEGIPRPGCRFA